MKAAQIDFAIKLLDLVQRRGNEITSKINDPRAPQEEREDAAKKLDILNAGLCRIIRDLGDE
jgi:hypothetical protein